MGRTKLTTEHKARNTHFTWEERLQIQYYWSGSNRYPRIRSAVQLGRILGKHESTIRRELKRGMVTHLKTSLEEHRVYSAEYAQNDADYKATAKGPDYKIGSDRLLIGAVEHLMLDMRYSPFAVIAHFDNHGWPSDTRICEKTLYNYIYAGLMGRVDSNSLLYKGKRRKPAGKPRRHSRAANAQRSILRRPREAADRSELGHWEMDTVVGPQRGSGACLLTLTERRLRLQITRRLGAKTMEEVNGQLDRLERDLGADLFASLFATVTADNGCEFNGIEGIEASVFTDAKRTDLYFGRPYCSSDRPTNENHNGIIRRFIPKGVDISLYDERQVRDIQAWMNNYPRKILGGKTPLMTLTEEFGSELLDQRILEVLQ
jgi:transposase, IS30 family